MQRNVATVVLAASMLAALAGCAYQDPLELPDLGPPARSGAASPYYSPYYGYGYSYGYGSGYRPGYDPYYNYYYGGADPRYYGPGVVYVPYPRYVPVPCADANRDGRCDKPPRDDQAGDGQHHGPRDPQVDHQNGGKHDGIPRRPGSRNPDGAKGDGPRVVAPAQRPAQVRPPEAPRRAAPPPPAERGPRVAPGKAPTVDDGSPPRRPD